MALKRRKQSRASAASLTTASLSYAQAAVAAAAASAAMDVASAAKDARSVVASAAKEATTAVAVAAAEALKQFPNLQEDIRELRTSSDKQYYHLNSRVDELVKTVPEQLNNQTEKLTTHFDNSVAQMSLSVGDISSRVQKLENWRWLLIGGGVVVAFLISEVLVRVVGPYVLQFAQQLH